MVVAICLGIGLLAGVCGGLFGIGGGLVIVPAAILALGFTQHKAQGTSLALLMMPVGIFGVANYWREGQVDIVKAIWIGLGFLGGSYLGSRLALNLDPLTMRRVFAAFLIIVAVYLLTKK
ncbi:MAG: hypothetical protein HONBIEJF_00849 [Fimbriimonadaceae bacterium]|nr:hypothetical protein [Fimbriimonadaceae bacterium]